ncbi:MAG: TM2 domain-containing protein [Phycisphaerales bacterium]|jgi:TM2 domain-containing membrane protein YozV|nr:TM2 domain-containing protein [Phycisphaerales bacterium]
MTDQSRAAMVYDAKKKSLLIAYLLWWFLGALGIHRMYAGRIGSGVAMLVLFLISLVLTFVAVGIFGLLVIFLWWLLDAILLPGMIENYNLRLIDRVSPQ